MTGAERQSDPLDRSEAQPGSGAPADAGDGAPDRPAPSPDAAEHPGGAEAKAVDAAAARRRMPDTLLRRSEFLAAARARKWVAPGMIVQARRRPEGEGPAGPRVGYTCSKKVGKAVDRNRAKRRLRATARAVLPMSARDGWDYVLIGRAGTTASRPFTLLVADLETALDRLHRPPRPKRREGEG